MFRKLVCEFHETLQARGLESIPQGGIDAAAQSDKQQLPVMKRVERSADEKEQLDTEVSWDRNVNHWRLRLEIARCIVLCGTVIGLHQSRRLQKPGCGDSKLDASR